MTSQQQVVDFYRAKAPGPANAIFRMGLLLEELAELHQALKCGSEEEIAKEMADVMYTLYGLAEAMGIDLDVAFEIVHASNMSKPRASNGAKVPKGSGYIPPDLSRAMKEQA